MGGLPTSRRGLAGHTPDRLGACLDQLLRIGHGQPGQGPAQVGQQVERGFQWAPPTTLLPITYPKQVVPVGTAHARLPVDKDWVGVFATHFAENAACILDGVGA